MGKVGWVIGILIVLMVAALVLVGNYQDTQVQQNTGCHYEYKMKNNKRVKVLDCD